MSLTISQPPDVPHYFSDFSNYGAARPNRAVVHAKPMHWDGVSSRDWVASATKLLSVNQMSKANMFSFLK
jgi:hypothetical protein